MRTLLAGKIHIRPEHAVHLYDHRNKMMPFITLSIFMNLRMTLNFVTTLAGQLMTFKITLSHVKSVTTTKRKWDYR